MAVGFGIDLLAATMLVPIENKQGSKQSCYDVMTDLPANVYWWMSTAVEHRGCGKSLWAQLH